MELRQTVSSQLIADLLLAGNQSLDLGTGNLTTTGSVEVTILRSLGPTMAFELAGPTVALHHGTLSANTFYFGPASTVGNTWDLGRSGAEWKDLYLSDDATIGGGMTVDTDTLVVDAANHWVGIGTTSPQYLLHIYEPAGEEVFRFHGDGLTTEFRMIGNVASNYLSVRPPDNQSGAGRVTTNGPFQFYINSPAGTKVNGLGFESLGTNEIALTGLWNFQSGGQNNLVLRGAVKANEDGGHIYFRGGDSDTGTKGNIKFQSPDGISDFMTVLPTGNIGIGTTSPDTKLQVVGDSKFGDDNTNYAEMSSTGSMVFVGSAGLVYGGISTVENAVETSITSSGVKVQVTIFNRNMPSNNITSDNAKNHVLITKAGDYRIIVSATVNSIGGSGSVLELEVMKNNGASRLGDLHADRTLGGGGTERGSIGLSDIVTLAAPVVATRTTYAFVDSNPDTITDSSNNFVADGFAVGQTLTIAGSTSNDGDYTIDTVAVGTLTLIAADTLVAEVAGDTVTLTGSETVELWIENETNTQNYVVEDVTLSLVQLGGA